MRIQSPEIESEGELVAHWRFRKEEFVGERGEKLRGGGSGAGDTSGKPRLRRNGDLRTSGRYGRIDAVGGVAHRGRDNGCGGGEGEPARFLMLIAYKADVDVRAGAHEAGADGSDADAFMAKLSVKALRETDEGEFAGDVGQKMRHGNFASDGCDVDDGGGALVRDAQHVRQRGLGSVERAEEIGGHGTPVGGEGLVFHRADFNDAGVVDEDIDATEVCDGVIDEVFGLFGVAEVGGDEEDGLRRADGMALQQGIARVD